MYAIEAFVGRKYGRWFKAPQTHPSEAQALAEINALERGERKAEATSFMRRVVKV